MEFSASWRSSKDWSNDGIICRTILFVEPREIQNSRFLHTFYLHH